MPTKTKVFLKEVAPSANKKKATRSDLESSTAPYVEPDDGEEDKDDDGAADVPYPVPETAAPENDIPLGRKERQSRLRARGPPVEERYIGTAALRRRYGNVSHMWVERRIKLDPAFPRPVKFGRLRFWKLSELESWERSKAAAS
jgi:predicted DNA-binding transcriptional regulator AlpA